MKIGMSELISKTIFPAVQMHTILDIIPIE